MREGRNPRWDACARALGREPEPWEFIIWNGRRLREWIRETAAETRYGTALWSDERHEAYNQWLLANVARPEWKEA